MTSLMYLVKHVRHDTCVMLYWHDTCFMLLKIVCVCQLQVTLARHEVCLDCFDDNENCMVGHHRSYHYYEFLGPAMTEKGNLLIYALVRD